MPALGRVGRGCIGPIAVLCALLGATRSARAVDKVTAASCVQANEQASTLRSAGKLREARAQLRLCSAQGCPSAVRNDCLAGAAQADSDVPTVAFSVQDPSGNDLSAVKVSLDGQPLAEKLDGKALDVDPGEHVFRFEAVGQPTVEKRLVIVEGQKNRHESVMLGEPKVAPVVTGPVPIAPVTPRPPEGITRKGAGIALGATGLGLLAVGGVSGLLATLEWSSAKSACGPTFPVSCANLSAANSDRSTTMVASAVADVTLGLGAVAVITGAVLVLSAPPPRQGSTGAARLSVTPQFGPERGGVVLQGSF